MNSIRLERISVVLLIVGFVVLRPASGQEGPYPTTSPGANTPMLANQIQTAPNSVMPAVGLTAVAETPNLLGPPSNAQSTVVTADFNKSLTDAVPEIKLTSFKVGCVTVKPYGILWSNMKYMTSRTYPESGQFILWVDSEEVQGENAFVVDARPTRIGMDLTGPTYDILGGLTGGGKVEVDFLGMFSTENQPTVRLRHIYWEAKNKYWRFLTGQTWDVVSPLLPHTVNFSVNWGVGNIGFRRTQFRVERYFHLPNGNIWTVELALAENVIQDFRTGSIAAGVVRETGNWPMLQGRTALTFHNRHLAGPGTVGVSGHIGETGFDFDQGFPANPALGPEDDARFRTWSLNTDVKLPLTERLSFQGELFTGSNLSNVLGGVVQGVCPCKREAIRATGGWAEVSYKINSCLRTNVGFGIDDPLDGDSLIGRTYNRVVYGNVFLDITDNLETGFEVSSWRTGYHNETSQPGYVPIDSASAPGKANVLEWTVRYHF